MIATWTDPARLPRRLEALSALPCALVLAAVVPGYPLGPHWLAAVLLEYGAILLRWPNAWLLLVPAALPVLDLTTWTGRFYLDEFDALLAVTGLVLAWRGPGARDGAGIGRSARRWLTLLCLSTVAALAMGAWPWHAPGLNSFNNYYSAWNGARLAKGLGWALLLWPALGAALARDVVKTQRRFALGMGLGVAGAALAVMWERAAFPGLLNFDSGYRVVGPFSAMHTGAPGAGPWNRIAAPVVKLALVSEAEGSRIDINDVSLRDARGRELLRNGGFDAGMDPGSSPATTACLGIWKTPGCSSRSAGPGGAGRVCRPGVCAALALWPRVRPGDPYAPALGAALVASLALSLLDSWPDFARIGLMVYLLLLQAFFDAKKTIPEGI